MSRSFETSDWGAEFATPVLVSCVLTWILNMGPNVKVISPPRKNPGFLVLEPGLQWKRLTAAEDRAFQTIQCKGGNFSCAEGAREAFKKNLQHGFLLTNGCLG